MMTRSAAALFLFALAPGLRAQQAWPAPLDQRVSIDMTGTLEELVDLFHKQTGVNVVLQPHSGEEDESAKSLRIVLKDVKGSTALRWIAGLHGCDFRVDGDLGVVFVSPRRCAWGAAVQKTYATDGIPNDRSTIAPPRFGLGKETQPALQVVKEEPKPEGGEEKGAGCCLQEMLIDLIKENVEPGTWEGGSTIDRDPRGRLIVSHRAAAHKGVAWFLDTLRAFSRATVTVSVEIADADGGTAGLLAPGAPAVLAPADADAVARRLRAGKTRRIQISGMETERVHGTITEETGGVIGFMKGNPIVGKWLAEAGLLDVRPTLLDRGRSVFVELRLSLGHTRSLEAVRTRPGLLPLHERMLAHLGTCVVVPAGGGVLLSLPSRNPADARPQICLLRASVGNEPAQPPPRFVMSPREPEDGAVLAKLQAAPPRDLELKEATVHDFAAWLREAAGVNVVVSPAVGEELRVSVRVKGLAPAKVLPIALQPHRLGVLARDEALFIVPGDALAKINQTCLVDVRDVVPGAGDFPAGVKEEGGGWGWTLEDLANLIKNGVHRSEWEEADGRSIQAWDGILILRNSERVIRDCIAFVDERRREPLRVLGVRADTMTLTSEAADAILGDGAVANAEQVARLLKAGTVHERLAWTCLENQRTSLSWDRGRDHLHDVDGEDPIVRADSSVSWLDLKPSPDKDGRTMRVDVRYEDRRVLEVKEAKIAEGVIIQSPVGHQVTAKTTVMNPKDRSAVFRWSAPSNEGEPARCRLLILSVERR